MLEDLISLITKLPNGAKLTLHYDSKQKERYISAGQLHSITDLVKQGFIVIDSVRSTDGTILYTSKRSGLSRV